MTGTRRSFLTLGASVLAAGVARHARVQASDERQAIAPPQPWFLARLPRLLEVSGTPGCAAVVLQRGRIVWEHYAGPVTAGEPASVTRDTMWPAASLGKPLFAAAALGLVSAGTLDLDKPLREYLDGHAAADDRTRRITARHVLSHSSGLPNWRTTSQPLVSDFEPGTRFAYSGEGYYFLQAVIESLTGHGIQQVMSRALFEPLRMTSSTFTWRDDVAARLAGGHARGVPRPNSSADLAARLLGDAVARGQSLDAYSNTDVRQAMARIPNTPPALPILMVPNVAGTLLTTPRDYAAFLAAVLDPSGTALALTPGVRAEMTKPQVSLNSQMGWGLGWGLETHADAPPTLWHWGDNGNWKNFVLVEPAEQSAVVIFTNSAQGMNVAERLITACTGVDHVAFQWL